MKKDIEYYMSFKYRFMKPIRQIYCKWMFKRNRLIPVDYRYRGIGKTYLIVNKALKERIPVIVGNDFDYKFIKRKSNPIEVYVITVCNMQSRLSDKKFPNGVLIDDSVHPTVVKYIQSKNIKLRGGFIKQSYL